MSGQKGAVSCLCRHVFIWAAQVNEDYVTRGLDEFFLKTAVAAHLIKQFHLQQIQRHARPDWWQKESAQIYMQKSVVSEVFSLSCLLNCHRDVTVLNICDWFYTACTFLNQIEQLCQHTIWWHWMGGQRRTISVICLIFHMEFIPSWTYELWLFLLFFYLRLYQITLSADLVNSTWTETRS